MFGKERAGPRTGWIATCLLATLVASALGAGPASAETEFKPSTFQAGAHPDERVFYSFNGAGQGETLKRVTFLPEYGFALEPASVGSCAEGSFADDECPPTAQLGVVTVRGEYEGSSEYLFGTFPVYELAGANRFVRIGFTLPTAGGDLDIEGVGYLPSTIGLQTYAYQLELTFDRLPQNPPLTSLDIKLWGVPAAPGHDADRFPKGSPGAPPGCPGSETTSCNTGPVQSSLPQVPFTLNLADCHLWNSAAKFATYQGTESYDLFTSSKVVGCEGLAFAPTVSVTPSTEAGFSPSGLEIDVRDPQTGGPTALSPAELRESTVTTQGLSFDPDVWAHPTCSSPGVCSPSAAVGTAKFEVAGLSAPIRGSLFLEKAAGGELQLLLKAAGAGVEINRAVTVKALSSERLRFDFGEQPRIPIVDEKFDFSEPPADVFRTPVHCGEHLVDAELVPWYSALQAVTIHPTYAISTGPAGSPCIGPAATVSVQLDPATIAADGSSQVKATIAVRDATGNGVPAEEVRVRSSDPLHRLTPVVDNGDGTYSTVITGSTTIGAATITATDLTSEPDIEGSATLVQTGRSGSPPGQLPTPAPVVSPAPRVAFSAKPPKRGTRRRPRFDFSADMPGATFRCKIDQQAFKPCTPPVALRKLSFGWHTFAVRAAAGATAGPPASWRFKIVRRKPHRQK